MLRNRNRNRDYIGYDPQPSAPASVSKLDPKDERLLDLSEMVGQLGGQNDLLNEDNQRLETENANLLKEYRTLTERNQELERQDTENDAGHKSVSQFIEELEEAIAHKKANK